MDCMSLKNIFFHVISLFLLTGMCFGKAKFTDRQVATMIPKYFARDHNAPQITRTRIYGENKQKILHLEINVNQNRYEGEMEYALAAMATVCQYAHRPFDKFVLIMESNNRQLETEKVEVEAKCTIDYFVFKRVKYDRWFNKCIDISEI